MQQQPLINHSTQGIYTIHRFIRLIYYYFTANLCYLILNYLFYPTRSYHQFLAYVVPAEVMKNKWAHLVNYPFPLTVSRLESTSLKIKYPEICMMCFQKKSR